MAECQESFITRLSNTWFFFTCFFGLLLFISEMLGLLGCPIASVTQCIIPASRKDMHKDLKNYIDQAVGKAIEEMNRVNEQDRAIRIQIERTKRQQKRNSEKEDTNDFLETRSMIY